MRDYTTEVREIAAELLRSGKVDVVLGYEWGPLPLQARPVYIHSADDVDRLIWNACCQNNLAPYLLMGNDKVAILAKGCDARAVITTIAEKQVQRENVTIVAIPCEGVIDRHKLDELLGGKELLRASLDGDMVTLVAKGIERTVPLQEIVAESCGACVYPTAPVYDVLVGDEETVAADCPDPEQVFADVEELEAMSLEERRAYFEQEFSRCIRCYSCRQACSLCYCQECFIDQTQPTWFGKTDDASDTLLFHIVRATHLAGRCVSCGACARACPMGIDVTAMNRKLARDVKAWYGHESGVDPDAAPLLSTFGVDDPEECTR